MKKQKFNKLSLFIVFLIIGSFIIFSKADAREGMDIEEDMVWKKGDDLTFNGPVYVWPGATLTIEKGADIKFGEDPDGYATYLHVSGGRIVANGTQDEPIKITGLPARYGYFVIEFDGDDVWTDMEKPESSFFRYVEISGGGYKKESCSNCQVFSRFIPTAYAFDDGNPAFNFISGRVRFENCRFYNNKYADVGIEHWMNIDNKDNYVRIINSNFEKNDDSVAVKSDIYCQVPSYDCRQNVLLKNDWFGDPTGPSGEDQSGEGKEISGHYFLDEWRKSDLIIDPVIVIPGITGSMPSKIIAGQLTIDPILHIYDNLILSLEKNGFTKNDNLFEFPYEWRNSNIITANNLKDKIDEIRRETGISRVDIVAHSMGGLLTRQYIESTDYQNDIDQLITLGTPHRGAPKSYMMWEAGEAGVRFEDKAFSSLFSLEAHALGYDNLREYIQGRVISVKELLPDYNYLEKVSNGEMKNYPDGYPRNEFLEMLNSQTGLDNLAGVNFYNIVRNTGGDETIDKFRVTGSTVSGSWEHGMPENFYDETTDRGLEYAKGDETVPLSSADGTTADKKIEMDSKHSDLPTKAQCHIFKELSGKDNCEYVSTFGRIKDILTFGVFSPIDIQIVAPDGKRMGKNFATGGEYDEIPGAYYSGFDTNSEFLTIPNPIDGEYKILTEGTEEGEYKIQATKIIEDDEGETSESMAEISGTAEEGVQEELKVEIAGDEIVAGEQDRTPPTIDISSPENKTYKNNKIIEIRYEVSDDVSEKEKIKKEIFFDSNSINGNKIDLSLERLGAHNVLVRATDEAGNVGEGKIEFASDADINAIISNVNHYFDLRLITNIGTRNYLRAKLQMIRGEIMVVDELKKAKMPNFAKDKLLKVFERIANQEIAHLINQIEKEKNLAKTINLKARNLLVESLESIKL